ncbi:MAG: S41 family peptidase [Deltaproteobacteria bacterium]|nr:S41 family peptidase [Deltaproteobacteria bacterium]
MVPRAVRTENRSDPSFSAIRRAFLRRPSRFLIFLIFGCAVLLLAAVSQAVTREQSPYAAISQLARVLVLIENNYVEPVDRAKVLQGAIKGMVAELDPHSSYMPPEDFKEFQSETQGSFGGVGIEVDTRHDTITVIAPIEGSPAARAGIRSGDKIIAVEGKFTRGQPLERIVRTMRGAPGTHVKITVQRPGVDSPIEFDLVREQVRMVSVVGRRMDGDVAYLRVRQFQQGTHDEFLRAVGKLREQCKGNLSGVVLDMRSNPGGLVDQATAIADDILDRGTIYTTRHRGKILEEASASSGGALARTPVVVLVNEYSASAAELVAGALQDHHRAVIVGAVTFGKGSVQNILELPGGAGIKLTTMLYYTPSGRSIQAEGIHPDVVVPSVVSSGATLPILRERDMEGHLPPESTDAAAPRKPASDAGDGGSATSAEADDAGDGGGRLVDITPFDVSRDVPANPIGGKDLVLSIGYQIVRGVISAPITPQRDK